MFTSKKPEEGGPPKAGTTPAASPGADPRTVRQQTAPRPEKKSGPSVLSNDVFVTGNIKVDGDIKVDGRVEGDLIAKLVQIGEKAVVKGKISAEEVVVNGHVKGKIRGIRVRLNSGARVEGDIIHETIAIEAGAHFEGTVKRQDNPLAEQPNPGAPAAASKRRYAPSPQQRPETSQS